MNAVDIIKTFAGFGIAFVLLPWLILPTPKSARNTLDVLVINFVRWLAIVVVATQVLAALRLYETTTLIILALIAVYFFKLRPMGVDRNWFSGLGDRISVRLANFGDRFESGEVQVSSRRANKSTTTTQPKEPRTRESLPSLFVMLLLVIPLIVVLGISYYLRVKVPAAHVSLSPSDNYTILTWTKLLEANQVYTEGIYPHGVHAILALWHKFSLGLDTADLIRFAGPLMTMLIPVGAVYTVLRVTKNPGAAAFAGAIFGIFGSRPEFLVPWGRQSAPLPQELSLGIACITLAFVAMAVSSRGDKGHLWTVGAGAFTMAMIHPLPLFVFLAVGGVLAVVTGILAKEGMSAAFKTIGAMVLGGLAGHIYIPLGLLFGKPIFAGIKDLLPFTGGSSAIADGSAEQAAVADFGQNAISIGSLIGAFIGFFGGFVMLASKRRATGAMMVGLSAAAIGIFVMFDTSILGIPAFYAIRIAWIVGPMLALGYGVGLAGALSIIPLRAGIAKAGISMVVAVLAILMFGAKFPIKADTSETRTETDYEAISVQTRNIVRSSENFTFSIVGIPEQRQRILGDGFFVELWVFARDVREQDAIRPGYELPIPTEDVYITIEKHPLIGLDLSASPNSPTNEYYRTEIKRSRIMAIVYSWAESYRQYHADMSIYYDDENIRIYQIHRTADFKLADESAQFKDYEYQSGKLFNTGPTIEQELNK